ncbi:MAG TPA: glycosyltransferase family 39 protein [Candidatus Binataceae bacterium]|nr:glycosyltransferase family 39 protein [Candidatus Binataceae bacterium]
MADAHRRPALRLLFIAAAALILYLPGLGRPALWEPDEGRYAEIAREMYLSGDYVTPRDDFVRYFEKPPLVYWCEAAAISIFGPTEFAIRLPAALFSAAEVVVTAALAEVMFGEAVAILAAIALGLSPLFFGFARFATLDPALAFFMTAALGAFYMAARTHDFARHEGRRWFVAAAALLALGTLAKGPVAPVLCGAIALIWLLFERRGKEIVRMPWVGAISVYGAIAIPWFALAAHRNPDFLRFFFIHEHVQRYLVNTEHGWGPWFFIPVVIGGTWPWFFFAAMGAREQCAASNSSNRAQVRFIGIWFLVIFVFFSIPRAKLGSYILPALPALSMLSGLGLYRMWTLDHSAARRIVLGSSSLTMLAAIAAAIAAAVFHEKLARALTIDACLIAVLLGAMAIAAFIVNRDGQRPGAFILTLALGMLLVMGIAARARNDGAPEVSYRHLAATLMAQLHPGCIVGSYRHDVHSIPFYTGYREALVSYRGELAPFGESADAAASFINSDAEMRRMWSSSQCFALIANRKDLPTLQNLTPAPIIVGCEGKKVALINLQDAHADGACGINAH